MAKPPPPVIRKPVRRWPGPLQFMAALAAYRIVTAHDHHATDPPADDLPDCDDDNVDDELPDRDDENAYDDDTLAAPDDWADGLTTDHDGEA